MGRFAVAAIAYGLGSIPSGYLAVRWRTGRDVRRLGSGSTGGRNVARQLGAEWGLAVGFLDMAKGALAATVGRAVGRHAMPAALVGVIAGHIWPITLAFRGGRGIAPAFGALVVDDPPVAALSAATFLGGWVATGRTAPGFALGVATAPLAAVALRRPAGAMVAIWSAAALVAAGHWPMIRNRLRYPGGGPTGTLA
jgi:glycerol-3-phosphate acyltransferase PlsY